MTAVRDTREWRGPELLREAMQRRQLECLRLAGEGLLQAEIGARLHLSQRTVKKDLETVRNRLGARNTAHAVAVAYRAGLFGDRLPDGTDVVHLPEVSGDA